MIADEAISRQDWNAARDVFRQMGSSVLGMDMTPVARAIAKARVEGYDQAVQDAEDNA